MKKILLYISILIGSQLVNAQDMSDMTGLLRQMMINMNPAEHQFAPTGDNKNIFGSVIDISESDDKYTSLILMSDGEASLLMSGGRGMSQQTSNKQVKELSISILNSLTDLVDVSENLTEATPPSNGKIKIFMITTEGTKVYSLQKDAVQNSPLRADFEKINQLVSVLIKQ